MKRKNKLTEAASALIEIVEGVRGERWAASGRRLVDTPEWAAFYVALRAAGRSPKEVPHSADPQCG